tara:strand:- start:19 stop:570 length:552 start_codon:yes stop_codon:yes gene_type:complete
LASLQDKAIKDSYKDLLTVAGTTSNEGLEATAKRVFDGEGIGSPLYLGTNTLDIVGTTTITGNTTMTGNLTITGDLTVDDILADDIKADMLSLRDQTNDTQVNVARINYDSTEGARLNILRPVIMKEKIEINGANGTLILDADNGLEAKDDGTLKLKSVSSLPSSPSDGDLINKNGEVFVAVP